MAGRLVICGAEINRDVAQHQGGALLLNNRLEGGLSAVLDLPLAARADAERAVQTAGSECVGWSNQCRFRLFQVPPYW
jgi:hypothetical protein